MKITGKRSVGRVPSLRRTVLVSMTLTASMLAILGSVSVASSLYQGRVFDETTTELTASIDALRDLRLVLNDIDDAAAGIMYQLGGPAAQPGHQATYNRMRTAMSARFADLADVAPPAAAPALAAAEASWKAFDTVMLAAPTLWPSGKAGAALTSGPDPFGPAWQDLGHAIESLTGVDSANIAQLQASVASAARVQRGLPWALAGLMGVSLLWMMVTVRRMSRRIVAPMVELSRAARAMRDTEAEAVIDVRGASAELQELARTIEETAATLRSSHGRLRDQAHTDALTGLPNRKAFIDELEIRFAARNEQPVGVLFIDLDDFKVVNDSMGHAAGDALLRIVGSRLRAAVRSVDLVARLGGDEFAVLVDSADVLSAGKVAGHVLDALDEHVSIAGLRVPVQCSIGVAVSSAGAESGDELLRNADFAMYMAKGRGKSCVEVFLPSMHVAMQTEMEFKQDLALAVPKGQLVLHYQPVLDLPTERVLGIEALVRWDHPGRGLLAPNAFIELAEETGDIVALGQWVLEQACMDLADQRAVYGDIWVSVNVSANQLSDPAFPDSVMTALARHDLPSSALILEITEHVAVVSTEAATQVLAQLRSHGVRIALDDFGVGFSSLRYLQELPVDVLKIDRSFVIDSADRTRSVLSAIVSMAHTLDLAVIAEGIEEQEQLDRLQGLGAMAGQGYLFARPMPIAEVRRALVPGRPGSAGLEPPRAVAPALLPAQRRKATTGTLAAPKL